MNICFLAPAASAHTEKWCRYFLQKGHEVSVISLTPGQIEGASVFCLATGAKGDSGDLGKLKYLTAVSAVKRKVKELNPDIVSVHYASSYGLLAALAGLKNYSLSVWGSDIYEFPKKSPLHKTVLKYSLAKAGYLFSTSKAMAEEAANYTNRSFFITPFGVDLSRFTPEKRSRNEDDGELIVGTVKGLHPNYGISDLLKGVCAFRKKRPEIHLQVRIAGKGPEEGSLRQLAKELELEDIVNWLGFISQERAAEEWANMDVAIIPSIHESFGVSSLEAQASGCALIISDVPGLMETTIPGKTAMVVPRKAPEQIAEALCSLCDSREERRNMGLCSRQFVAETYELSDCFGRIEQRFFRLMEERDG